MILSSQLARLKPHGIPACCRAAVILGYSSCFLLLGPFSLLLPKSPLGHFLLPFRYRFLEPFARRLLRGDVVGLNNFRTGGFLAIPWLTGTVIHNL